MEREDILQEIASCVINANKPGIKKSINKAFENLIPVQSILNDGLMKGMGIIGRQFRDNDVYIPEVIMASKAMKIGLKMIKPFLIDNCLSNKGKIVIGTIYGDLHDLGKNVVGIMLEGAGFSIIDLGVDVPTERFIEAVDKEHPDILALSCTLTNTLTEIGEVVNSLRKTSYGKQVKVLVGGLAVTQDFARSIGADTYGYDANHAVVKALAMVD